MKRRTFLKLSALTVGASALGLGVTGCNKETDVSIDGFPEMPETLGQGVEATVDLKSGEVKVNSNILVKSSVCMGCYSSCGVRAKIDKQTGRIMKLTGNPYHPKCAEPALPYDTTIKESYQAFSLHGDKGHTHRATICARGNSTFEQVYDPMRITTPLKRAGERGSGKWKPISWEQLIEETVEGGKIFADLGDNTVVEGFRKVYSQDELINPDAPEMGPKSNGLVWISGGSYGRINFAQRFVLNSFGSTNFYGHTGT